MIPKQGNKNVDAFQDHRDWGKSKIKLQCHVAELKFVEEKILL